jgi:hypothetical protein
VRKFAPPPALSRGCVEREGEEDPNWDYDNFITEATEYFEEHPEEKP